MIGIDGDPFPYFVEVAAAVIGDHLIGLGFEPFESTPSRLTYRRGGVAVACSYFLEDLPTPSVAVSLGTVRPDGATRMFGMWRALDASAPAYNEWTFHDRPTLEAACRRVVDDLLVPYGPDLWDSPDRLERHLDEQADEAETRYLTDVRHADLMAARRAFDEAILKYTLLDPASLSAADKRKLFLARRATNPQSES